MTTQHAPVPLFSPESSGYCWRPSGMLLICLYAIIAVSSPSLAAAGDEATPPKPTPDDKIGPFLGQHCLECHSGEKPKRDLHLGQLAGQFDDKTSRDNWEQVLMHLRAGTMPPKSKPRPPESEVQAVTAAIMAQMHAADAARRKTQGRVVLRRLNRFEYENTVRDLLGVDTPLKDLLPLDTSADGFDNIGDALHTSSFLMDQYLEASDTALNQAIANRPQPPPSVQKQYNLKETHQIKSNQEKVIRKLDSGAVVLFSSSLWQQVSLSPFYPSDRGRYRFRISASGIQSGGKPVVYRVLSGGGGMGGLKPHLVGYFDAPADQPTIVEFVDYMEPRTTISILPYGLPSAQHVDKIGADTYDGPGLSVDWIEVEGPLNDIWPPENHRRLFGDMAQGPAPIYNQSDRVEVVSKDPAADADRILRQFIRRAFRRSITDEDVKPFTDLVAAKLDEKLSFEQAIRVGLAAAMASPEFLFLRETPGQLDDFSLASRLSYFLWSSMPDEELFQLAEKKLLSQPDILHMQVERMLKHPQARAFTENFVGQWLGLRDIDLTEPGHIAYPEFDEMLKVSMVKETELFFAELLKDDLSLLNFVASDFTMLNGRLAKHYGIPGVEGWEFKKHPLSPGSHRGGVLTMASVLKVTANGTATSPVTRGAWVLERILGTPPPRPPENVAALIPDIRGATTIREQLAKHRQIDTCASCHVQIDPPGFALESFDVIGGWRDRYRLSGWARGAEEVILDGKKMHYYHGLKVNPADVLADGRAFADIDEFKQLLLADKDQIARALTRKLVTYATGGPPESSDLPEIDVIVGKVRDKNYGFRSLIHQVVASQLFQMK